MADVNDPYDDDELEFRLKGLIRTNLLEGVKIECFVGDHCWYMSEEAQKFYIGILKEEMRYEQL